MTTIAALLAQSVVLYRWRHVLSGRVEALLRRSLADRSPSPALRQAAAEAAEVRALADTYRSSDPDFAADLYAAADRHEREFEEVERRSCLATRPLSTMEASGEARPDVPRVVTNVSVQPPRHSSGPLL